ncbi:E3 ubiquitin-protein ligase TRIM21-like [Epinephelus fuscoguttatus]|uniref:E3 ubiquitin-protein ligase TRIM21-like n=1 Tax=Epinephelus fuscoguttatus TaxID=293821 RepID=UPI0020D1731A|nr:E3 ubiquitin-protein ligase TRIM21-like [Epinephelus fuscoguttatus]
MMAANCLPSEDQLLCSICLEVFTDPVTLPCGHNFCKSCITQHLRFNSQRQCPMCKEQVNRKCKLKVNTFISEMAAQFRQSAERKSGDSSEQQVETPAEASSDVPIGTKRTRLKSCLWLGLACLTVGLAINYQLHQTISSLKIHQLFGADASHKFHHIVPLKEEYEVKKTELLKTEAAILYKIVERQLKLQEIRQWAKLSKEATDRERADGVQVFNTLIQSLERAQAELIGMTEAKQKTTNKQAKDFIQGLEQEISELIRRRDEVKQLSRSEDHLHFLQSFPSVTAAPLANKLPEFSVCPASYGRILRTTLVTAVDQLTKSARNKMEKLDEADLKSIQQTAVDVTLDPDTAHPTLILSDDGKQVHYGGETEDEIPDNFVLGKQGFSCERFSYDVQVKGKTVWVLGVVKESVRNEELYQNSENDYWAILQFQKDFFALTGKAVSFSVSDPPEKVRVFVDYEEGLVSFYNADSAALLYSFTGCSFTEKLYPVFSPGFSDSAPLIISPVNQ